MSDRDLLAWNKLVNITKLPEWDRNWDPAGWTWIYDASSEDLKYMGGDTLLGLIDDMASLTLKREQVIELLALEGLEYAVRFGSEFDSTRQVILDALHYAWEVAATPNDSDILHVLALTQEDFDCDMDPTALFGTTPRGKKEWWPGPMVAWDQKDACGSLMGHITYEHKPDYYDRYLVFRFGQSYYVSDAVEYLRELRKREEHLADEIGIDLDAELVKIQTRFDGRFMEKLVAHMAGEDASQRRDFHKEWKKMLQDKSWRKGVKQELLDFLASEKKNRGEEK